MRREASGEDLRPWAVGAEGIHAFIPQLFTESAPCVRPVLNAGVFQVRGMGDCNVAPSPSHPCTLAPVIVALLSLLSRGGIHFSSPQSWTWPCEWLWSVGC